MYKSIFIPIILLFCTIFLTACPEDDPKPVSSKKELLKKSWKLVKVTQTGNDTPLYQSPLPAGQTIREDYSNYRLVITNDTEYVIIQRDNSIQTGSWELASNDTKIILDKGEQGKEVIMDILELRESSLKIRFVEPSSKTGNREMHYDFAPL